MIWLLALFLAAAQGQPTPEDCPPGTERVPTNNPIEPFHCKPRDSLQPSFIPMIPKHKLKISCPPGTQAVRTPGQLERWRCVRGAAPESADPEVAPVLPDVKGEAPAAAKKPASAFAVPKDYSVYTIKGQVQLEYPTAWHMIEGWSDDVPTLYIEFDTGRQGKQVTMVVSKINRAQASFEDMDEAIAHEKEFQNAADAGGGSVGTFPAKFTKLADTSRTAYVLFDQNEYYTLSYSAPEDLFKTFLPVYQHLLKTFKIGKHLTSGG